MIAEHEFVTTFEQDEALAAAAHILTKMGFAVTTYDAKIVAKRGVDKPPKAVRERQLPQSVEMTFDRGRCHLAASIMLTGKPKSLHSDMITTVLSTIERVLVHGQSDEEALEAWRYVDTRAGVRTVQHSGCRRITFWVLVGFLCLLLLGCVIGIIASAVGP